MPLVKIILIALIVAIISLYLKKYSPETAVIASIAGGLLIVYFIFEYAFNIATQIKTFFANSNINSDIIKITAKITIIAYIVEFASGTVRDMGETSLADKVLLAGKIAILSMSFPIISSLFTLISKIAYG